MNSIPAQLVSPPNELIADTVAAEYRMALSQFETRLVVVRYSASTRTCYTAMFRDFLRFTYPKRLFQVTKLDVLDYHRDLIRNRGVSASYQNQSINAIKFYLEQVLGHDRHHFDLERPKKRNKLPTVISEDEVIRIFKHTTNLKHQAMLMTIYSAGLRISELLNLRIADIDSDHMRIWVRDGKGQKDRITVLSQSLLKVLRRYFQKYQPKDYLFESYDGGIYSASSVRKVLRRSVQRAGIRKHVKVHTLRHSFATHLLESGTNLRYIQTLLGHTSSRTTEIYTHVSSKKLEDVRSPLDKLTEDGIFER